MKAPCQAVVVRYAPDPSAGEALNIGVVLLVPSQGFFGARFLDKWQRISGAFPQADLVHLRRIASAVDRACAAASSSQLTLEPERDVAVAFDAIIPPEDASLVRSAPLTGVTQDPERTLDELFNRYVVARARTPERESRKDIQVWHSVAAVLGRHGVLARLQTRTLKGRHYEEQFDAAWKNARWNVVRPLSFDLVDPSEIAKKAASWVGRILSLEPEAQDTNVHLIIGQPSPDAPKAVRHAGADGVALLEDQLAARDVATVVSESEADQLAERIKDDLEHHVED